MSSFDTRFAGKSALIIGGSYGVGLEIARQFTDGGGTVILVARNPERLAAAADLLGGVPTAVLDATDLPAVEQLFDWLEQPVDHVIVPAGGSYYAPIEEIEFPEARYIFEEKLWLALTIAQKAKAKINPGGSILFFSGTAPRRPARGVATIAASVGAMTQVTKNLALELAPVRFNLLAAGFLDTPLSATLLGDGLDARREQLKRDLPIGRIVEVDEVAALATHIMWNGALTGAVFDIDGGESLIPSVEGRRPETYSKD